MHVPLGQDYISTHDFGSPKLQMYKVTRMFILFCTLGNFDHIVLISCSRWLFPASKLGENGAESDMLRNMGDNPGTVLISTTLISSQP